MNRYTGSPKMRDYAERLIGCEDDEGNSGESAGTAMVRVFAALRKCLITLVGVEGFTILLSRALTLAKSEVSSLARFQVKPDGSLDGISECCNNGGAQPGVVLIAHLLGLLADFIGEGLVVRILLDRWPDSGLGDTVSPGEDEHDATRQSEDQ